MQYYAPALRISMLMVQNPRGLTFMSGSAGFGVVSGEDDPGGEGRPTPEQIASRRLKAMQGSSRYLRAQGEPKLADEALAVFTRWQDRWQTYQEKSDAFRAWQWRVVGSPPYTNARVTWWTLAVLAVVAILLGLGSLVARDREGGALRWPWWQWLALAALLIIPMQIWFGLLAEPMGEPERPEPETLTEFAEMLERYREQRIPPRVILALERWLPPGALAVGVWLVVATGVAVRRRWSSAEHTSAARYLLRDLLRLAAPTLALMVLLSVLAVPPAYNRTREVRHEQVNRWVQADMVYFGLMKASDKDQDPR
jgi:hypothetical protein